MKLLKHSKKLKERQYKISFDYIKLQAKQIETSRFPKVINIVIQIFVDIYLTIKRILLKDSFIQINIICREDEFIFNLNYQQLKKIQEIQTKHPNIYELRVPPKLVARLRQSAIMANVNTKEKIYFCYELGFTTYYSFHQKSIKKALVQTLISLDGDILHKVSEKCLADENCQEIISAHHWLINQLLQRLRASIAHWFAILGWIIFLFLFVQGLVDRSILDSILNLKSDFQKAFCLIIRLFSPLLLPVFKKQLQDYLLKFFKRWIWTWAKGYLRQEFVNPKSPWKWLTTTMLGMR